MEWMKIWTNFETNLISTRINSIIPFAHTLALARVVWDIMYVKQRIPVQLSATLCLYIYKLTLLGFFFSLSLSLWFGFSTLNLSLLLLCFYRDYLGPKKLPRAYGKLGYLLWNIESMSFLFYFTLFFSILHADFSLTENLGANPLNGKVRLMRFRMLLLVYKLPKENVKLFRRGKVLSSV